MNTPISSDVAKKKKKWGSICDSIIDQSDNMLHSFLEKGSIMEEIPVIKHLFSVIKTINSFSDYLLAQKIIAFINSTGDINELKSKILAKIKEDEGKFGELFIFIIDKNDSIKKSIIAAKVFRFYLDGEITQNEMEILCNIINKIPLCDIHCILDISKKETISNEEPISWRLLGTGLIRPSGQLIGLKTNNWDTPYHPTPLCKTFEKILLECSDSPHG